MYNQQAVMEQQNWTPERWGTEAERLLAEARRKAAYLEAQKRRTLELQVNWALIGYFFSLAGWLFSFLFLYCVLFIQSRLHCLAREGSASCTFSV